MSFLDIKDPTKRDHIVSAYLATVKRLQHRDISERAQELVRREDLNHMFEPVIESTEKSTEAVTKELVPIQDELKILNDRLLDTTEEMKKMAGMQHQQHQQQDDRGNLLEQYLHKYGGSSSNVLDRYFAIQRITNNRYEMGTKVVDIDEHSNIIVDNVKYSGTTGLWALIMMNNPPSRSYTPHDLLMYRDLVHQTKVMNHPHNVILGKSRYKQTKKWTHIFPLLETVSNGKDNDQG